MTETSTVGSTPDMSGTPLVELRHIRVAFGGVHAVDDVSIDLYPGEVIGLVGGNGAGQVDADAHTVGRASCGLGRDPHPG